MAPAQSASAPEAPHSGNRRVKRRLMYFLVALYGLSLAAAAFLILRSQAPKAAPESDSGGLLSLSQRDSVGWVSIRGPIYTAEGGKIWEKGVDQWARRIRALAETKGVKAIVLDINSPGGSVGAVQELYSQIQRVRQEKRIPFVALFGDVSASGGYYIAMACDKIVAHPGTLTGSIGVIFSVGNLEGLFQKIGYKVDPIKSGKHKDIGSPARPMTKEERGILQAVIDDAYKQFLAAVSQGRHIPEDQLRPLADGRIFSGRQALAAHLVDMVGDSVDALELAGKLAGIKGRPKIKRDTDRLSGIVEMLDSRWHGLLSGLPFAYQGLEYRWPGL
ncbi:MAG: signal peptide peptidase SppA [Elusimicrobia bacterium]|nr:signal peptide peptidase SppA [Elusimicrobiota bacterium]